MTYHVQQKDTCTTMCTITCSTTTHEGRTKTTIKACREASRSRLSCKRTVETTPANSHAFGSRDHVQNTDRKRHGADEEICRKTQSDNMLDRSVRGHVEAMIVDYYRTEPRTHDKSSMTGYSFICGLLEAVSSLDLLRFWDAVGDRYMCPKRMMHEYALRDMFLRQDWYWLTELLSPGVMYLGKNMVQFLTRIADPSTVTTNRASWISVAFIVTSGSPLAYWCNKKYVRIFTEHIGYDYDVVDQGINLCVKMHSTRTNLWVVYAETQLHTSPSGHTRPIAVMDGYLFSCIFDLTQPSAPSSAYAYGVVPGVQANNTVMQQHTCLGRYVHSLWFSDILTVACTDHDRTPRQRRSAARSRT